MYTVIFTLVSIYNFGLAQSDMEAKVVGHATDISIYPHAAFMLIVKNSGSFLCGASILNQKILITAAHCIEKPFIKCTVYTGHTDRTRGDTYMVEDVKAHENYDTRTVHNDIGLVLVKTSIKLGKFVQRISITPRPPLLKMAAVAGWGLIDEIHEKGTHLLHHAELNVLTFDQCRKYIPNLPHGCICAGSSGSTRYASNGDSGSALIVNNYTQIGVVSYKRAGLRSIVAFSDTTYFYRWIKLHSKRLYCRY